MGEPQAQERETFRANFEALKGRTNGATPPWLIELRDAAMDRFADVGFPGRKQEEWKYTDLSPVARVAFTPAAAELPGEAGEYLESQAGWDAAGPRLVFVGGRFAPSLSRTDGLGDVVVCSLADALRDHPDRVKPHLALPGDAKADVSSLLNAAFIEDGAFVLLPAGKTGSAPIHLIYVQTGSGSPSVAHPRSLLVAQERAEAAVVESYLGFGDAAYLVNPVTQVVLGPGARLAHTRLGNDGSAAYHLGVTEVHQARDSAYRSDVFSLGGGLQRHDVSVTLADPGCECTLNGVYLGRDRQHIDNHTVIDHASPNCNSWQLYKGILDDRSTGVFNGRILVREGADGTDAKQSNPNLLLSEHAAINTKPQLEIFAEQVKCTHGATVGRLDTDALFYLRARAIPEPEARQMLVAAFAGEVVQGVEHEALRGHVEALIAARLG